MRRMADKLMRLDGRCDSWRVVWWNVRNDETEIESESEWWGWRRWITSSISSSSWL